MCCSSFSHIRVYVTHTRIGIVEQRIMASITVHNVSLILVAADMHSAHQLKRVISLSLSLSLARSRSLSLARSRSLSLARSRSLSLARSTSTKEGLSLSRSLARSLSLSLHTHTHTNSYRSSLLRTQHINSKGFSLCLSLSTHTSITHPCWHTAHHLMRSLSTTHTLATH